ncbi:hypothetical protein BDZ89DRAFT_1208587 [Hymenopellis radicata]|nr:hypothetical protein BDZ89DRAFT_1208587 [Hymenopellis radicata]
MQQETRASSARSQHFDVELFAAAGRNLPWRPWSRVCTSFSGVTAVDSFGREENEMHPLPGEKVRATSRTVNEENRRLTETTPNSGVASSLTLRDLAVVRKNGDAKSSTETYQTVAVPNVDVNWDSARMPSYGCYAVSLTLAFNGRCRRHLDGANGSLLVRAMACLPQHVCRMFSGDKVQFLRRKRRRDQDKTKERGRTKDGRSSKVFRVLYTWALTCGIAHGPSDRMDLSKFSIVLGPLRLIVALCPKQHGNCGHLEPDSFGSTRSPGASKPLEISQRALETLETPDAPEQTCLTPETLVPSEQSDRF